MKRPSREINIFSLSALDLFASALGAFILLAVIQFPYTKKNEDIENARKAAASALAQCQAQLQSSKKQLLKSTTELETSKDEAKQCKQRLKDTFLAIILKWKTEKQDIDLHVIDPAGNEFYFKKHNRDRNHFPNSNAEISVDQIKGPGVEVWEYYKAVEGSYKIYALLYSRNGNSDNPSIKTAIYYRDGVKTLTAKTLTGEGKENAVLLGTVTVDTEGNVTFE